MNSAQCPVRNAHCYSFGADWAGAAAGASGFSGGSCVERNTVTWCGLSPLRSVHATWRPLASMVAWSMLPLRWVATIRRSSVAKSTHSKVSVEPLRYWITPNRPSADNARNRWVRGAATACNGFPLGQCATVSVLSLYRLTKSEPGTNVTSSSAAQRGSASRCKSGHRQSACPVSLKSKLTRLRPSGANPISILRPMAVSAINSPGMRYRRMSTSLALVRSATATWCARISESRTRPSIGKLAVRAQLSVE